MATSPLIETVILLKSIYLKWTSVMAMVASKLRADKGAPAVQCSLPSSADKATRTDNLTRKVYGIFGIPIDALDRTEALNEIYRAINEQSNFLLSTPNVNFLIESGRNPQFRDALIASDLCSADGMPIVWLARLLGVPVKERVSGSDLFESARNGATGAQSIGVFLFGGGEGIAEKVADILNAESRGMHCAGWTNPGFGTVQEMSSPDMIQTINASEADLLAVFLSAHKAQSWLSQNHDQLRIPVRGQFGATINYQAGVVRRAPIFMQKIGLEWLWRIREEPYLWRRYWTDGVLLAKLVITGVLPITINLFWRRLIGGQQDLSVKVTRKGDLFLVGLDGDAVEANVDRAIAVLSETVRECMGVCIDLSLTRDIDSRFFGLFLLLRKQLRASGGLSFTGLTDAHRRIFRLNRFEYLLD